MQITSLRFVIVPPDHPRLAGRLTYVHVTEAGAWEQGFREGEASEALAAELTRTVRHILDSGLWILLWDEPSGEASGSTEAQVVSRDKFPPGEIVAGYEVDQFWTWLVHEDHMSVAAAEDFTAMLQDLIASGRMRIVQQR